MRLNTETEEVLRVLYELSDITTLSEISEQLALTGCYCTKGNIKEKLDKLHQMRYVFPQCGHHGITAKGIAYFQN